MNLLFLGLTLGTIGKITLGLAVLRVHMRIFEERNIDWVVLKAIKNEHFLTMVSIVLILAGYVLEVMFYNGSTGLLNCTGDECAAAINAAFSR